MLLTYNVNVNQNNNGVYCYYNDINPELFDMIYNYIIKVLDK